MAAFDDIANRAYGRVIGTSHEREEYFVHELISNKSIDEFNAEADKLYDRNTSEVRFYSGFIHGKPTASFLATNPITGVTNDCAVELGDLLLVRVHNFVNPATGKISKVERRAMLVQAKMASEADPFPPGSDFPISSSWKDMGGKKKKNLQQFYLYNKWPVFDLNGKDFSLSNVKLNSGFAVQDFPLAKYGFARTPGLPAWPTGSPVDAYWSVRDPDFISPSPGTGSAFSVNQPLNSLGRLLEVFVDAEKTAGMDFDVSNRSSEWDRLINGLLDYCELRTWASTGSRLRDPARVGFSRFEKDYLPALEMLSLFLDDVIRDVVGLLPSKLFASRSEYPWSGYSQILYDIDRFLHLQFKAEWRREISGNGDSDDFMRHSLPVLVVVVSKRGDNVAALESEAVSAKAKADMLSHALHKLVRFYKWR